RSKGSARSKYRLRRTYASRMPWEPCVFHVTTDRCLDVPNRRTRLRSMENLEQHAMAGAVIVIILLIMSAWSLGVMFDRWFAFTAARKQSRQLAPFVAGALRQGNLDEAIRLTERNKKSHLAKVLNSGLMEFRTQGESTEVADEQVEATKRALDRTEAI